MGVIGSTLDPVNLIVHKPLDTPTIGLLFCASYLIACLLCKEMFYLCCHVQIYELNGKHTQEYVMFYCSNTSTIHLRMTYPYCFSRAQGCITVGALIFHEYFTTVKKSSKAWKHISLTRMLYFSRGQTLLQWLLKKAHCPQQKRIFQMFSFFTLLYC